MAAMLKKPIILIVLAIVIGLAIIYLINSKSVEGFYPVDEQRIKFGEEAARRYNDYGDTQEAVRVNPIYNGPPGDKQLFDLLNSPAYEGDTNKQTVAGLNNHEEFKYKAPPELASLMAKIKKCESVKSWDCEAFEDPEFNRYCGLCVGDAKLHDGTPVKMNGLYIDQMMAERTREEAARTGKKAEYGPTFGVCKAEFIRERPYCDTQKDRYECDKGQGFEDAAVKQKCALCVNSVDNKFVYIGKRRGKDAGYQLEKTKQIPFSVNLKLAFANKPGIDVQVRDEANNLVARANESSGFMGGQNVAFFTLSNVIEGQKFKVSVRFPEYKPYAWTDTDRKKISDLVNPPRAPLVRAAYGPHINNYKLDDPRAADVTKYLQTKFKIADCSKMNVLGSNDALGGDPTYGIYKQLRLAYSFDGVDFAYGYGGEGGISQPIIDDNYKKLCPASVAPVEAERSICETNERSEPTGRVYTQGNNANYFGAGGAWCVAPVERQVQGMAGVWESFNGLVNRYVPVNRTILQINGYNISSAGPPIFGTLRSSKYIKRDKSMLGNLPDFLFWTWAKDNKISNCEFTVEVPATLRDPAIIDDMKICPSGPMVQTAEAAAKLQAGACEKPVNGEPQGPGTYTPECIKSLFLASGCTKDGKALPTSVEKARPFMKNKFTGNNKEIDEIIQDMDTLYAIATTGKDINNTEVGDEEYMQASEDCYGKIIFDPCDTALKSTGPHTSKCLDYLFRNAGKDNVAVGGTYVGVASRSSGTDRSKKTPIMYCQRAGSMSPIGADGQPNFDAIQAANSYGSVSAVKEFYRKIHYDANYNMNATDQKIALNQCYGVAIRTKAPICKGVKARYIYVRPSLLSGDNWIQISQIQVFNNYDVNVAQGKPTQASSTYAGGADGATPNKAVDGQAKNRSHPGEFHAGGTNATTEYWMVDLGKTEEIAYVVYFNRADCCQQRARGMRVQLVDESNLVVKEKMLTGAMQETLMFANAKPSGLIRTAADFTFIPGRFAGSVMMPQASGETFVRPISDAEKPQAQFITEAPTNGMGGAFSFKHKQTNRYLRVQGFRARISADDGSDAFKRETSFKVVDSIAGNPGEISFEPISNPGTYLGVADNKGVYTAPAINNDQKKLASWRLPNTI